MLRQSQPTLDHAKDIFDLLVGKRFSRVDVVPFGQATAAAGGGGVLGNEYGMASHGCLATVVARLSRCQPLDDELPPVLEDHRQCLFLEIGPVFRTQAKAPTKLAAGEGCEEIVYVAHGGLRKLCCDPGDLVRV